MLGLVIAFVADVVVKMWVRAAPEAAARFSRATRWGIVGLAPSTNDVLAFSLPVANVWIWPMGWAVVVALIVYAFRAPRSVRVAMVAIILGAISNLFDRTLRGGVTDYLALFHQFPAFNIADLLVLGGVVSWWWRTRCAANIASAT